MIQKVNELRSNLQGSLKAAEERLNGVKASLDKASSDTEAAIKAKLDAAKNKLEQSKRDAESAKAKAAAYLDEKKAGTEAKIAEWKRERHQKKLDSRADGDEDYAVSAIAYAVMAIDEAECATLEAIASRIDAEAAREVAMIILMKLLEFARPTSVFFARAVQAISRHRFRSFTGSPQPWAKSFAVPRGSTPKVARGRFLPLPTSALTTALIVPREDLPPPTH